MKAYFLFFPVVIAVLFMVPVNGSTAEQQVVIDIQGMTCELCPIAIKKSLSRVEGVKNVKISFKEKTGWVTVNETVTDQELLEAITKPGDFSGTIRERTSN
jgi:mercuric ion binding protein